jgi:hypothetical protein
MLPQKRRAGTPNQTDRSGVVFCGLGFRKSRGQAEQTTEVIRLVGRLLVKRSPESRHAISGLSAQLTLAS